MPESRQQMAAYIIKDAVDDFQDVIDGVKELNKMFNDPQLQTMIADLQRMSYYVERKKSELDKIHELPIESVTRQAGVLRSQPSGYAIYYYQGIDYYPAAGTFPNVPSVYSVVQNANLKAKQLSREHPGVEFGVYPVDHNYEIIGKAITKYIQ